MAEAQKQAEEAMADRVKLDKALKYMRKRGLVAAWQQWFARVQDAMFQEGRKRVAIRHMEKSCVGKAYRQWVERAQTAIQEKRNIERCTELMKTKELRVMGGWFKVWEEWVEKQWDDKVGAERGGDIIAKVNMQQTVAPKPSRSMLACLESDSDSDSDDG